MSITNEKAFEEAIEQVLVRGDKKWLKQNSRNL